MLLVRGAMTEAVENLERACELMPNIGKYKQMLAQAKRQAGGGG